jgi:multidrug efflux pump subunit AcrA (membrane-fusion protein)
LRVRVDVAQADAAKVVVGQAVRIAAEAAGERLYRGEVTRVVSRADLQKVAFQVYVRVLDPDDGLRPDQLCQARFGAPPGAASRTSRGGAAAPSSVWLPRRLVVDGAIWTLDPTTRRARRTPVTLGAAHGERVEILSGADWSTKALDPGAAVLRDGDPVRLRER